ncbi:copper homeostasis protein CutC [Salinicoccus siamensis]|uniref:PF03932 family protein CutC n=2 Tax=Salinicoccus siamensis TaxID=381830 RepID=A0ABV5Z616_9STAP
MIIEGIAVTMQDVQDLNDFGADRIELCTDMEQDGLTPSTDLIQEAAAHSNIPVNVMIRPHGESFCYSREDMEKMRSSIRTVRECGAAGIVLGCLTDSGTIDEEALAILLDESGDLDVTFHKAFDAVDDQLAALEILMRYPKIKTLLTSGGQGASVNNTATLKELIEIVERHPLTIMPGGGLNTENVSRVMEAPTRDALHFGTGIREGWSYEGRISKQAVLTIKNQVK